MTVLDTAMAATMLNSSERRIRRLVERGHLTNVGKPHHILIDLDQLSELIAGGKVKAGTRKK